MALFEYQGLTASDRLVTGQIEAGSYNQACELLKQMQLEVRSVEKIKKPRMKGRIPTSEFLLFNRQLGEIADSGIPLSEGLRQVAKDVSSGKLRKAIDKVCTDLDTGMEPSEAFEKYSKDFPPMYGQIVKAGIKSGQLGDMLASLNRHIETSQNTKRMLWETLLYPTFLFVLGTFVFFTVGLQLLPAIETIKENIEPFGRPPHPLALQFWAIAGFLLFVIGTILTIIIIYALGGLTKWGRIFREKLMMCIPFLGGVYKRSHLTVLSDAMSVLINAGCDMPETLKLSAATSGFEHFKKECNIVAEHIQQGENLVEAGRFSKTMPQVFFYTMQTGSQRNELSETLHNMSDMYGWQTSITQSYLSAIIAPIAIIFVGLCIGLMVFTMFNPFIRILQSWQ